MTTKGSKPSPKALVTAAMASEQGESYAVLLKGDGVQLGTGARRGRGKAKCFVEVTIHLCGKGPEADLARLEWSTRVLKGLKSMGYATSCRDGYVVCEHMVDPSSLELEASTVRRLIEVKETNGWGSPAQTD